MAGSRSVDGSELGGRLWNAIALSLAAVPTGMQLQARDRVRELTAALTVVSLALVFGTAGGFVPETLLPRIGPLVAAIPHVNAVLSATALVTIGLGIRAIARGNVARHRAAMVATTVLVLVFLALSLSRIALEGPAAFPGPARDTVLAGTAAALLLVDTVDSVAAGVHRAAEAIDSGAAAAKLQQLRD